MNSLLCYHGLARGGGLVIERTNVHEPMVGWKSAHAQSFRSAVSILDKCSYHA
jgi:hypothetical protein